MSISAEDALRSAMLHATGYSVDRALRRSQDRLASLGYAIIPIAIDEWAVEKAAKKIGTVYPRIPFKISLARAAIVAYLEAVRDKP